MIKLHLNSSGTFVVVIYEHVRERGRERRVHGFVLNVECDVPPQVDEIECIIPAYEGLALK